MNNELFIEGIRISWDEIDENSYLKKIEAISSMQELSFHSPVTFFVGENGSGKSTLLEGIAITWGFNAEGGTRNYSFSTYDSHSELCDHITLVKGPRHPKWGYFLRAESFYNVATKEEEYGRLSPRGSQYYHLKSHGESFLAMAENNLKENGLYIFDEPEAALSPQRQLTMLYEIDRSVKEGSQEHPGDLIAVGVFIGDTLQPIAYEDTDSYKITRMFLNDRERFLKQLLDD